MKIINRVKEDSIIKKNYMTTEQEILSSLAEIVLRRTNYREHKMRVSMIISVGHLNGNIFNPQKMFNHTATTLIRFLANVALIMGEKKFKAMMYEVIDAIWKIADNDELLDEINNQHSKKKTHG